MPTIEADSNVTETQRCPLCDTPLDPQNPNECTRCDWNIGYRRRKVAPVGTDRDKVSVIVSVIPGLGHIYKGHLPQGILFMAGGLFAAFMVSVIATFTMGFGLLLMPLYWVAVMMHVYWLKDLRAPKTAAPVTAA